MGLPPSKSSKADWSPMAGPSQDVTRMGLTTKAPKEHPEALTTMDSKQILAYVLSDKVVRAMQVLGCLIQPTQTIAPTMKLVLYWKG